MDKFKEFREKKANTKLFTWFGKTCHMSMPPSKSSLRILLSKPYNSRLQEVYDLPLRC